MNPPCDERSTVIGQSPAKPQHVAGANSGDDLFVVVRLGTTLEPPKTHVVVLGKTIFIKEGLDGHHD